MAKRLIFIALILIGALQVRSQVTTYGYVDGKVSNKVTGSAMSGVNIEVKKNGSTIATKTSGGNGKFKLELDIDAKYTIVFTQSGFISRYIEIDLTNIPTEYIYDKGRDIPLDMTLVENPKNPDPTISGILSTLQNLPTASMKFDKKMEDVNWDFKVTDKYMDELNKLLAKIEADKKKNDELDKKFKELVANGDKAAALTTPDYTTAVTSYQEALKLKDDAAVKTKLDATIEKQKLAEANKNKEQQYKEFIDKADKAFASKDYAFAKTQYEEAVKVKPDPHPTKRITEINTIIAGQLEADKKYNEFLATGNKQLQDKKYDEAIKSFQEAGKLKPVEQEPKDLEAKAKSEKDALGKKEAEYTNLIKQADADFKAGKYDAAIKSYEGALDIKQDTYPKSQIEIAKKKIEDNVAAQKLKEEEERKQKEYDDLIKKADGELAGAEYDKSISSYEAAQIIKPKELYPPAQIEKAKKLKKEAEDLAKANEAKEKLEKDYKDLIAKADGDFGNKEWDKSITGYEAAQKLKTTEKYPADQIIKARAEKKKEAEDLAKEAEKKKLKEQYDAAIAIADADYNAKNWTKAITGYDAASKILSTEQYPKDQIIAAKAKIKEEADLAKNKAEQDKKYNDLITKANLDFTAKKYNEAISKYEEALAIKDEQLPKDQIAKAKEILQKDLQYKEFVQKGDDALKETDYDNAISNYEEALKLKTEKYAQDQLAKAKKGKEDAALTAANEQKYKDLIAGADTQFNNGKWDDAIKGYDAALKIKATEKYPNEQITAAKAKKAEEAAGKLAAEQKLAKYKELVTKADNEFNAGSFKSSIDLYTQALSYKENDPHATERIELAKQRLKESEDFLNQQYAARIKAADDEFNKGNYKEAIEHYKIASNMKKTDEYPKNQIIAAEAAIKKKQQEDLVFAEKKKKYDLAILKADGEFNTAKYNESINSYNAALAILDEQYPKDQIEKAKTKMDEIANANKTKAELEANYKKFIDDANTAFSSADYDNAIANYESALGLKKNEKYPTDQIIKAKALKAELEKNAEINAKYKEIIGRADAKFNTEQYEESKEIYKEALKVKPTEVHPKNRLIEIEEKLKGQAAIELKKQQYAELIKKGDKELNANDFDKSISTFEAAKIVLPTETLPDEKIAEAKRRKEEYLKNKGAEALYKEFMNKGMNDYNATQFDAAITNFEGALNAKPGDAEAEKMLAKAKKEKEAAIAFIDEQYALIIKAADGNFNEKKLKDAKDLYTRALKFKKDEVYPKDQIAKIDKMMLEVNAGNIETNSYNALITQGNNNFNTENYKKAREYYVKASDMKPEQDFPKKRIEEIDRLMKELEDARIAAELKKKQEMALNNPLTKEDYYGTPVNISIEEAQKLMLQKNLDDQQFNTDKTDQIKLNKELSEMDYALKQDQNRLNNHTTFIESKEKLTIVGTNGEAIRVDNVTEYKNFIEDREIANSELSNDYNKRIMENHNNFTQQKIELEYSLAGQDRTRLENVEELKEYKETRYNAESDLSGNINDKLWNKSEELHEDQFQLQDQLAGQDATRQQKVEQTADLKEERYRNEAELSDGINEKLYNKSEELHSDQFQLQDQLAGQDITRQEKTNDLLGYKEYRYELEGELSGTSDRRILDKRDEIVMQNFQLQDQLAGQDITRQEKTNDLLTYKEARYESESNLSAGVDQKLYNKSEELRANNFQLQDQLAGQDKLRQQNVEEYKTIEANKNSFESNAAVSQTNKVNNTNDKFTTLENEIATKQGDLSQNNNQNYEKLKAEEEARINNTKFTADQNQSKTRDNLGKLEELKYRDVNTENSETATLISEKQFEKKDVNGKVTEITIQRMVKKGNTIYEYLMIINKSGNNYFKNGKPISETQFSVETSVPK